MRFHAASNTNEMMARIIAIHILVLLPSWSLVKNLIANTVATTIGIKVKQATGTYHQWMYSLRRVQKTVTKRKSVAMIVKIPIVITPHLIGKQPQQENGLSFSP